MSFVGIERLGCGSAAVAAVDRFTVLEALFTLVATSFFARRRLDAAVLGTDLDCMAEMLRFDASRFAGLAVLLIRNIKLRKQCFDRFRLQWMIRPADWRTGCEASRLPSVAVARQSQAREIHPRV